MINNRIFTIPNVVTTFGILCVILYFIAFISETQTYAIPALVIAVGISDILDGFLARRFGQHSKLGEFLDPLRDRLLGVAIICNIIWLYPRTATILFATLIVMTEIGVARVNWRYFQNTNGRGRVHALGKLRGVLHWTAGIALLAQEYWPETFAKLAPSSAPINAELLLVIMLVGSILAGISYSQN